MNIIEAIQKAESGFIITNHLAKMFAIYYVWNYGTMHEYTLIENKLYNPQLKTDFTIGQILLNSWEYFPSNTFEIEK